MSNRRIVCITKHPTHQDRYHRITHVGVGTDANRASEKLDVATVIRNIKSLSGDRYWDPMVRKPTSLFEGVRTAVKGYRDGHQQKDLPPLPLFRGRIKRLLSAEESEQGIGVLSYVDFIHDRYACSYSARLHRDIRPSWTSTPVTLRR